MGVDAEMFAAINDTRTDEEIFATSVKMSERFSLWVDRERRRHGLTPVSTDNLYYGLAGGQPPNSRLVEVNTFDRYYGPGYERGDCLKIIGMAEFLEAVWPEATVWYGGDSGDFLDRFGKLERDELKAHFFSVGGEPYYCRGFAGRGPMMDCDWCHRPISVHSASGDFRMGNCLSCGGKFVHGSLTGWIEVGRHDSFEVAREKALATIPANPGANQGRGE